MGWDQGSQARDLESLVVGSVSVVLQVIRDSFPTELRKNALMEGPALAQLYFGVTLICSGT